VKNTIRNTLLLTAAVAALVAGTGLASAQGERREMPAAATPEQKAPAGKADQQKGNAPQKSESVKPAPTAHAPDKAVPDKAKPATTAQTPDKAKPAPTAQAPDKANSPKTQTDGQAGVPTPSAKPDNARSPSQNAAPNAAAQKPGASTAVSSEQHVRIRETLRGEKAERLKNVPFAVTMGDTIPRTVHLHKLPVRILEYVPQYRDYEYILVGDEILIVDPRTFRIVAVIPA
jgi:cytoskeletal protein RodZ